MELKQGTFVEFILNKKSRELGEIEEITPQGAFITFPHAPHLNNFYDTTTISEHFIVVENIPDYYKKIKIVKSRLRALFNQKYIECCNYLANEEFKQRNYKAIINYLENNKCLIEELALIQEEQETAKNKANFNAKVRSAPQVADYILNYISDRIQVVEEQLKRNKNSEAYTSEEIQAKEKEFNQLNQQLDELNLFQQGFYQILHATAPPRPRGRPKKKK